MSALLEKCITAACLLEAAARKPGNVHPAAAFDDLTFEDLVQSAHSSAPVLARTAELSIGRAVLDAVRATTQAVGGNSNLGIVLLLAPLCAVPARVPLAEGIGDVLARLTREDAALAYEAIRLARPGGLGSVDREDVAAEPTVTLLEAMRLAAGRDRVAEQYATNFELVLGFGAPRLAELWSPAAARAAADALTRIDDMPLGTAGVPQFAGWELAVITLHLELLAKNPDTLIAGKCGWETAREAARRAQQVLDSGWKGHEISTGCEGDLRSAVSAGSGDPRPALPQVTLRAHQSLLQFDRWLREDGHRRNPGSTADLVAASLFAALRDECIDLTSSPANQEDHE